jgi:hypothetical protein
MWRGRVKLLDRYSSKIVAESAEYEVATHPGSVPADAQISLQERWTQDGRPLTDTDGQPYDPTRGYRIDFVFEVSPLDRSTLN